MKWTCLLLSFFLLLAGACNNKTTTETNTVNTDKDSADHKETATNNDPAENIEKKNESLEAMTPLSSEQMEKLAPAELLGASRTELSSNTNLGTVMVVATYQLENNADLRLTILDCAGPGGAGAYGTLYANLLNQEIKADDEYTKTIDFNGTKAIEHGYSGLGEGYSITWFTGTRFLVSLEGKDKEIIKQAAKGLNIK